MPRDDEIKQKLSVDSKGVVEDLRKVEGDAKRINKAVDRVKARLAKQEVRQQKLAAAAKDLAKQSAQTALRFGLAAGLEATLGATGATGSVAGRILSSAAVSAAFGGPQTAIVGAIVATLGEVMMQIRNWDAKQKAWFQKLNRLEEEAEKRRKQWEENFLKEQEERDRRLEEMEQSSRERMIQMIHKTWIQLSSPPSRYVG